MVQLNASRPFDDVLDVWFGRLVAGIAPARRRRRWFRATPAFDAEIAERFAAHLESAAAGGLEPWRATAHGALAYVLVTDQFSRQIHRGTARAFATDPLARVAAREVIARGDDRSFGLDERSFLYLPFEHSESPDDQDTSVQLFTRLRDETPTAQRALAEECLVHAIAHSEIIARFRRFPHRNAALGRESTAAELDYLRTASGFGQTVSPRRPPRP